MEKAEKWNKAAVHFQNVYALGKNSYNDSLVAFLKEQGMIFPGSSVIDIGCGVGKYGKLLGQEGCRVTLADISPVMLEYAAQNMVQISAPWKTILCDFDEMSAQQLGRYDLAIATMSPAVHDISTAIKFSAIAEHRFIACFSSWQQPERDEVFKLMGIEPKSLHSSAQKEYEQLVECIKQTGFNPEIYQVPYCWSDERSIENAVSYFTDRLFSPGELDESGKTKLAEAIKKLSHNGIFTDSVNTQAAWICW